MQYSCVHGIFEFVYLNMYGVHLNARLYIRMCMVYSNLRGILCTVFLDVSKIGYTHFHYISLIIDSIKRIDGSRVAQISVVP